MLILEKKKDILILKSMGASNKLIKQIFTLEGWLISIIGVISGATLGIIICLIQQNIGIVKMPGNFMVEYYPTIISPSDIIIICLSVIFIGFIASIFPVRKIISQPE